MSRELKFRAWLEGTHEDLTFTKSIMAYNVSIGANGGYLDIESKWDIHGEYTTVPVMQFTGLKDKFGNDIYEGDIVRWDDGSNGKKWRVAQVLINPDLQFKIIRINCDYPQSAKEGYVFRFGRFIYTDTENHLEVIGNIYENPELIVD